MTLFVMIPLCIAFLAMKTIEYIQKSFFNKNRLRRSLFDQNDQPDFAFKLVVLHCFVSKLESIDMNKVFSDPILCPH